MKNSTKKNMKKETTATIVTIIVIIIVLGGLYWVVETLLKNPTNLTNPNSLPVSLNNQASSTLQAVPVTNVPNNQLPDRFPKDIPLEAGAAVVTNFNAINSAGMFQASRTFISSKSMSANFSLYQNWLKTNGWSVTLAQNDKANNRYFVMATKGGDSLNILIRMLNDKVVVSINDETKP